MDVKTVDVFSDEPLKGNPVAVVLNGSGLSEREMQDIARWTNLSETTFVLPATEETADYNLRIFTPEEELPFAGHPSLGTLHALVDAGLLPRKSKYVQQCKRGLIELNTGAGGNEFGISITQSRSLSSSETAVVTEALQGLSLDVEKPPMVVDVGPKWAVAQVKGTSEELLSYVPDQAAIYDMSKQLNATGICVYAAHRDGGGVIEVRTFAPASGVSEDPVCGSGQAAVAFYRAVGSEYSARQGTAVQRDGRVTLRYSEGKIWVGGAAVTVLDGKLHVRKRG